MKPAAKATRRQQLCIYSSGLTELNAFAFTTLTACSPAPPPPPVCRVRQVIVHRPVLHLQHKRQPLAVVQVGRELASSLDAIRNSVEDTAQSNVFVAHDHHVLLRLVHDTAHQPLRSLRQPGLALARVA